MGPVYERSECSNQLRPMSASLSNQSENFYKKVHLPYTSTKEIIKNACLGQVLAEYRFSLLNRGGH